MKIGGDMYCGEHFVYRASVLGSEVNRKMDSKLLAQDG